MDGTTLRTAADWLPPGRDAPVLEETRALAFRPWDERAYLLDVTVRLRAARGLVLERTPFTTWGGYGGLTMRGTPEWTAGRITLADGSSPGRPAGQRARWADLVVRFDDGRWAGVALLDHPGNPRHPTPWYGGTDPYGYLNAALLFHEPLTLAAEELALDYRVIVRDGLLDVEVIESAHADLAGRR
jgi:hypothetical protein